MRQTSNLGLALYDASDKMNITGAENSLNHNMELIDEYINNITNRHNDIVVLLNEIKTLVQNGGTTEQIVALLDQAILDSAVLA